MTDRFSPPPLRDQLLALAVAAICALAFLRGSVLPTHALLPFPPELLVRMQSATPADELIDAEVFRGNLAMGDKYNQSLAWDRITQDRFRNGDIPTWTRDIAGGVPFVPQMGQLYHPFNILLFLFPSTGIYGIWYLLHLVLFGFFAYRFMRRIAIRHPAALFGMIGLILGFWAQARIHHNVMLTAVLPVFAALSCTHHLLRCRGGIGHVALLAACIGLSWMTGFAPGSLMCTYLVFAYAIVLTLTADRGERLGPVMRFGLAVAIGLALAAVQLVPILQAAAVTSRGTAQISQLAELSLEFEHLATALWPTLFSWPADHFYHGMATRNAWPALAFLEGELNGPGFNFPETAFYIGIAPLVLAFGALRDRATWFFGAAALFGLTMALGWWLRISQFLPGAHSGDVKRFLLLFGICAPVVAALGLDRVLHQKRGGTPLTLGIMVTVTSAVLFLLHLAGPTAIQDFYGARAEQLLGLDAGTMREWVRAYPSEPVVNRDHLLTLFGWAASIGLVVVAALWRPGRPGVVLLCLLTVVELLWHGGGTIVAVPNERVTTPPPILVPVLESTRPNGVRPRLQRLMPPDDANKFHYAVWPNMAGFFGAEDLGAYSPLPKQRMEEFFTTLEPDEEHSGKQSVVLGGAGVGALRREASLTHPLADLIGIEWVIAMRRLDLPGHEDRTPHGVAPPYRLYRRTTALPRATFVGRVQLIEDSAARRRTLGSRDHRPADVVILEDPTAPTLADVPIGSTTVTIQSHADERVVIAVRNTTDGYLRLADPYDAGWTATIDGKGTPVFVADHYFRAVFLPAGDHEVVFQYDGFGVRGPRYLTLAALLLILIFGVLGWIGRTVINEPANEPS